MTGWRMQRAAEPEIVAAMGRIQDSVTSNPTSGAVRAVPGAHGPQDFLNDWVTEFACQRQEIVLGLNAIPGISCVTPAGAFYVFPNVSGLIGKRAGDTVIRNADDFADYLLAQARRRRARGPGFGAPECRPLLRHLDGGHPQRHRAHRRGPCAPWETNQPRSRGPTTPSDAGGGPCGVRWPVGVCARFIPPAHRADA